MFKRFSLLIVCLALLAGCADKEPASIKITKVDRVLRAVLVKFAADVSNEAGEVLAESKPVFAIDGSGVATLENGNSLRCNKCGKVTVTASSGKASASIQVDCRLVDQCPEPATATLDLTALPSVHDRATETAISVILKALDGTEVKPKGIKLTLTPAAVAVITRDDEIRCVATGDAKLVAEIGKLRAQQPLKCRLVDRIEAPRKLRLIIPNAPKKLWVRLKDERRKRLSDVAPTVSSSDGSVVSVSDLVMTPHSVGNAVLTVTAGAQSREVRVTVVKKIRAAPLMISDGYSENLTLQQGNYEVEVVAKAGRRHGVTLAWIGGQGCRGSGESRRIVSKCRIANTGALILKNPSTFGMGSAAQGFLNVYLVP